MISHVSRVLAIISLCPILVCKVRCRIRCATRLCHLPWRRNTPKHGAVYARIIMITTTTEKGKNTSLSCLTDLASVQIVRCRAHTWAHFMFASRQHIMQRLQSIVFDRSIHMDKAYAKMVCVCCAVTTTILPTNHPIYGFVHFEAQAHGAF